ncbi:GNAT family N-acetyltransferase [Candidatus Sumerlaeota bacterium]|nr:GNAT family N-acetyltransferase [Candidatus Sumerlaeota bacterium]
METSLRPLTSDNLTQASDALASAFFDDPLLRHLILEEAMRRRTLPAVMRANLRLTLPERESHVLVDESGRVLGAIGAMPPGKYPYPILRLIRYNLELFLRPTPWEPPLLQFMKGMAYQKQWDRLHCKEPHWYIYIIGVHADHHGKGHGKKLMEAILVKARASGHPIARLDLM